MLSDKALWSRHKYGNAAKPGRIYIYYIKLLSGNLMRIIVLCLPQKRIKRLSAAIFIIAAAIAALFIFKPSILGGISKAAQSGSFENEYSQIREPAGKLAIVIDDFGLDRNGVKEMMSINRHLTFAIMPFLKYSEEDADDAYEKGYEVIIHLAMEPYHGKREWLGPKPILSGMPDDEVRQIVRDAIENIPHASGANIHMGSKASSEESIMKCVLEELSLKDMYFVDSRTSSKGIADRLAQSYGIACYDRHIFLDEGQPIEHVIQQLRKAMELSIKQGKAVAIGHVGHEGGKTTAQAIQEMLPEFDRNNVQLVYISELSGQ